MSMPLACGASAANTKTTIARRCCRTICRRWASVRRKSASSWSIRLRLPIAATECRCRCGDVRGPGAYHEARLVDLGAPFARSAFFCWYLARARTLRRSCISRRCAGSARARSSSRSCFASFVGRRAPNTWSSARLDSSISVSPNEFSTAGLGSGADRSCVRRARVFSIITRTPERDAKYALPGR